MASGEEVPACAHRYLSRLSTLAKLLHGPECLRPSLEVHGGLAYLVHHIGDITAIPGALLSVFASRDKEHTRKARSVRLGSLQCDEQLASKRALLRVYVSASDVEAAPPKCAGANCVAVHSMDEGRAGPPLGKPRGFAAMDAHADWLLDVVPLLKGQDDCAFYKQNVLAQSTPEAPVVVLHRAGRNKGLAYAALVAPNAVSLRAVRLMKSLLRPQDRLAIVHFVQDRTQIKMARDGFLRQFEVRAGTPRRGRMFLAQAATCVSTSAAVQDATRTQIEVLCCERGSQTLVEAVQALVYERAVDVVVLATDTLGQRADAPIASVSVAMLRHLADVSVLVCKANTVGAATSGAGAGAYVLALRAHITGVRVQRTAFNDMRVQRARGST